MSVVMETKVAVAKTWDDLVFENRNKEYGAYSVRKRYSDRVIYALFICLSAMVMAIVAPTLIALAKGEETPLGKVTKEIQEFTLKPKVFEVVAPPKQQVQQSVQRHIRQHRDVFPVVTTQPVADDLRPEITPPATDADVSGELGDIDIPGDDIVDGGNTTGTGTGATTGPDIVMVPEVMPHYIGGEQAMVRFVQRTIHYPASARRTGVDGRVFVSFIIDRDGNIKSAEVIRGLSADCDAEALRLVKAMPRWEPGRFNNMPVAVKMVLPIRFVVTQ